MYPHVLCQLGKSVGDLPALGGRSGRIPHAEGIVLPAMTQAAWAVYVNCRIVELRREEDPIERAMELVGIATSVAIWAY